VVGSVFIVAANAQNSIPVPNQIVVEQDDHVATFWWNGFPKWGADNPAGVYGYQIIWGPTGAPTTNTTYVQEPVAQLQPLDNGPQYSAVIRAIDSNGRLSAPTSPIIFTGSEDRVNTLRQQMNGFFDDFNLPAGPVDETKWNVAVSHDNDPTKNGFFINNQYHAHSMLSTQNGDRGQLVARPRAIFDIAGRTGTIVFDLDGAQSRNLWYLDLMPNFIDITGHIDEEFSGQSLFPGKMLRIKQSGNNVGVDWIDANGNSHFLGQSGELMDYHIKLVTNVRRHWKVLVSQSHLQIFIDGKQVCAVPVNLPWTKAVVHLCAFSYNTPKANEAADLMHWDNFGFDAPPGSAPPAVTYNYRTLPYDGSEFRWLQTGAHYTTAVAIPDNLQNAEAALLFFTLQNAPSKTYQWGSKDAVTVNGQTIQIPQPSGLPGNPSTILAGPYSMYLPVPVSMLKQGINTLTFSMKQCGVLNIHIEIRFPAQKAPTYTQPTDVAALLGVTPSDMPPLPDVGPSVTLEAINSTLLWPYMYGNMYQKSLPVAGTLAVHVNAFEGAVLVSTGKQPGLTRIELLVDNQVVASIATNLQVPALGGAYVFTVDTTKLTNGKHEIFARGYSPTGTLSVPDYANMTYKSGSYAPLYVNVAN
jgi:hypothetical protein